MLLEQDAVEISLTLAKIFEGTWGHDTFYGTALETS